ncbi:unnamed protein product [Cuscuta campestris]|uniref:Uncharacterized protein n=1 Tax=Cuscuta campestris TaxID=132261 RepID=A0A484MXC4_9ASTE|nr:unnamed protein product [Cuscuta campestris]
MLTKSTIKPQNENLIEAFVEFDDSWLEQSVDDMTNVTQNEAKSFPSLFPDSFPSLMPTHQRTVCVLDYISKGDHQRQEKMVCLHWQLYMLIFKCETLFSKL